MIADCKPYPTIKDSGIEWLGEVPAHWRVLPNRAVFAEVKETDHSDEQMLSVTISSGVIRQDELLEDTSRKDQSRINRSAYKLVNPGDIAYNKMRAWQGAIGVSRYRGIVSPAYIVQRPLALTNATYMHHLFRTPAFAKEAERCSYGIASDMWSLRPEDFKTILVCVPPPAEQTAIVRFLDHTDRRIQRYIHAKGKIIALLEEQKQAVIHQAVTGRIDVRTGRPYPTYKSSGVEWLGEVPVHWEMRRLRNVAEMRASNVDKHTREDECPVRLCNYTDVYYNERIRADMSFMNATATIEEVDRFRILIDDVLITKDSESWDDIGVSAVVESTEDNLVCGYHLALLRPDSDVINGKYLCHELSSLGIADQFYVQANGVTRFGLSQNAIKSVWLPVPSLPEQTDIVRFLNESLLSIDKVITRAYREINLFHEYRIRLIADVVTGKLDVRGAAAALPEVDPLSTDNTKDSFDVDYESTVGRVDIVLDEADA